MGLSKVKHLTRRGKSSNTATLISAWSMESAETNTTDLIGAWSMEGALVALDHPSFGSAADAPSLATAEQAHVCGTAYDVPVLVKRPGEDDWVPLTGAAAGADETSEIATRLIGY